MLGGGRLQDLESLSHHLGPVPSPGITAILYVFPMVLSQCLMHVQCVGPHAPSAADARLHVRQQAAAVDELLHERRERLGVVGLALRQVLDGAGGEVDAQAVARLRLARRLRAHHDRQPGVDRVAVEDARERRRDDDADAGRP